MDLSIQFPMSVLIVEPKFADDEGLILTQGTKVVTGGPSGSAIVFTVAEFAERYAEKVSPTPEVVYLDTREGAAEYMREMKRLHGCTSVVANPQVTPKRTRVSSMPIDDLIALLEAETS